MIYSQRWRNGGQGQVLFIHTYLDFGVRRAVAGVERQYLILITTSVPADRSGLATREIHVGGCDMIAWSSTCSRMSTAASLEHECHP